jgi:hypothetical protein
VNWRIRPYCFHYRVEVLGPNSIIPITDEEGAPMEFATEAAARAEMQVRIARYGNAPTGAKRRKLEAEEVK